MINIKQSIFVLMLLVSSLNIWAQENKVDRNAIYYELGGTGFGPFSVNYERNIHLSEKIIFAPSLGASLTNYVHVGGTHYINDYQLYIPVQANFLFGENNHLFEAGFGMPLAINDDEFRFIGSIYVLRLGYRYHHKQSGFLFRASVNPSVIVFVPAIMGGLSVGYTF